MAGYESAASMSEMNMRVNQNDSRDKRTMSTNSMWKRGTENTPVYAVLSAVAEVEESTPVELPPLYESIDPEALNDLFTSRAEPAVKKITFQYAGYGITVHGSGEVEIQSE